MKILPNDGLSTSAIKQLQDHNFEVIDQKIQQENLPSYIQENEIEILLVRSATKVRKDLIDACPSLKIIGRAGVGMDNIDVEYAKEKGIKVINTPKASSRSVAELVFSHALSISRFLQDSNRAMPLEGDSNFAGLKKSYSKAMELGGKTLGILGLGRIGIETAKLGLSFGMNVIASDSFKTAQKVTIDFPSNQSINIDLEMVNIEELLKRSDILTLHVPSQKSYIIDKKELDLLKPTAILINASRGGVVNEEALLEALDANKLFGAGLDVFENEPTPSMKLLMHPKVSLSPHIGGNTVEAQQRIGFELAEQIIEFYLQTTA